MEEEQPNAHLLSFLKKSYTDNFASQSSPVSRLVYSEYTNLDDRFRMKQKNFKIQYAHIYFNRLIQVRPLLQRKVEALDLRLSRVIQITPKEKLCIIGTLYKEMKLKPSILHRVNRVEIASASKPSKYAKRTSGDDFLYIEDETGRVRLNFDHYEETNEGEGGVVVERNYKVKDLSTGLVVALIGKSNELGVFFVEKLIFCDVAKNVNENIFQNIKTEFASPLKEASLRNNNIHQISDYMVNHPGDEFIAILSGLNFLHSDNRCSTDLKRIKAFLFGSIPDSNMRNFVSNISRIIFTGNLLKEETEAKEEIHGPFKAEELYAKAFQNMQSSMILLDDFFSELSQSINIDLMPGANDPSDDTLPQQPLNRAYFPKAYQYANFCAVTNPHTFKIGDAHFLGTSGQNILDLAHYTDFGESNLDLMEASFYWRNIAPTAPDTLRCHPFDKNDPFFLEDLPHVYFVGNMKEFSTRLFLKEKGKRVSRLITIPEFSETHSLVVVNIKNLDTFEIKC